MLLILTIVLLLIIIAMIAWPKMIYNTLGMNCTCQNLKQTLKEMANREQDPEEINSAILKYISNTFSLKLS